MKRSEAKVYELEENGDGTLSAKKVKKSKVTLKGVLAACGAALGIAFEVVMGLPVYAVIGAVAIIALPATLISRAKRRAEAVRNI